MGMNYYLVTSKCQCCNQHEYETDLVHIGKKSLGWQFSFHGPVYRYPKLRSWEGWKAFLAIHQIVDENNKAIAFEDFVLLVEGSKDGKNHFDECSVSFVDWENRVGKGIDWKDDDGWSFSSGEFC
jgi:hypothetical protein